MRRQPAWWIRRIISAPAGSEFIAIERAADPQGEPTRIRITDDPDAPVYGPISRDETHPYRQTELLEEANKKLPKGAQITSHDSLSVRRAHAIDETSRPDFVYQPKFGSPQYSDAFVDWMVTRHSRDNEFFEKARQRYYDLTQRLDPRPRAVQR